MAYTAALDGHLCGRAGWWSTKLPRSAARARKREAINRRVSRDVGRKDAAIHLLVDVGEEGVRWSRPADRIEVEAELDGVYIIRTTLEAEQLGADEAVEAYLACSSKAGRPRLWSRSAPFTRLLSLAEVPP